jgi:PhnB protein
LPNPIPAGYHSVTPYLVVSDVAKLMDFLTNAFGATEREKLSGPDGRIAHAEMLIGNSIVMMGQPPNAEGKQSTLYLYVTDVDATYQLSLAAGAASIRELRNEFYGDRTGAVRDPLGNNWYIATHVEDVSIEEMQRRMKAQRAGG